MEASARASDAQLMAAGRTPPSSWSTRTCTAIVDLGSKCSWTDAKRAAASSSDSVFSSAVAIPCLLSARARRAKLANRNEHSNWPLSRYSRPSVACGPYTEHTTLVCASSSIAEPAAQEMTPVRSLSGRNWSICRPSARPVVGAVAASVLRIKESTVEHGILIEHISQKHVVAAGAPSTSTPHGRRVHIRRNSSPFRARFMSDRA